MDYPSNVVNILKGSHSRWLVTGVAGFIGSNLLECLLKNNQTVVGLDDFSTGYRHNLEQVKTQITPEQWSRFHFVEGDIRDFATCQQVCEGVDYVLHHAALGSVPASVEDPILSNAINIDGFLNVLTAARNAGVARFVYAASSAAYGDHPGVPKMEGDVGNLLSPYALTKYVNELYADVFARCYGMECIGLRYFNIFGPRQDPAGAYAAVIPKWVDAMLAGEPIYINGDGTTSRDFCFVANVVQANVLAATCSNPAAVNQVYNIAVGKKTSLNELFQMIRHELDIDTVSEPIYRDFRVGDVLHSQANIGKAQNILGYQPDFDMVAGVREMLHWYISHRGLVS